MDKNTKFDISKLVANNNATISNLIKNMPKTNFETSSSINKVASLLEEDRKEMIRDIEEQRKKKEEYDQDILNTLKKIEGNTANLTTIITLIQQSNEKQSEIYSIITELLALAKERDKEIVESNYRKIMNKITTFTEDVETIITLTGFATMVLNILKTGA